MIDFSPSTDEIVTLSVTTGVVVVMLFGWLTKKIAGIFFWIVVILCLGEMIYTLLTGETLRWK